LYKVDSRARSYAGTRIRILEKCSAPSLFGRILFFPFLKHIIDQILDVFRRPVRLDLGSQGSLNLTPRAVSVF
jgi:hypothetical protein